MRRSITFLSCTYSVGYTLQHGSVYFSFLKKMFTTIFCLFFKITHTHPSLRVLLKYIRRSSSYAKVKIAMYTVKIRSFYSQSLSTEKSDAAASAAAASAAAAW